MSQPHYHPLYKFKDGQAYITEHARSIWIYNDFIVRLGEDVAIKLFKVFHYMADLSLENPFREINEGEKLEVVIRGVCPDLSHKLVDWNDFCITDAIEYTRKCYETASYRKYLASKTLVDKITNKIHDTYVDVSKESGNSGEIKKAYELLTILNEQTKKLYEEYLDEIGTIQVKGQGKKAANNRKTGGKSKELE
jgi:hypothetical protein